jgi:hypothetical protein
LQAISSSFATTSSYALTAQTLLGSVVSASYSSTSSYALNADLLDGKDSTIFATTGSNTFIGNQIITGSILMSGSSFISGVDYVDFDTTASNAGAVGRLKWNDTDGTLDIGLKGGNVTLQIGQEEVARVVNKTGANLLEADYYVVRVRSVAEGGAQGQRLAVVLAQANNDANSATTLGVVTENIDNNQEGFITLSGQVRNINTTGTLQGETWVDGDLLYLSPTTPGHLTNIKPQAPQHMVIVGYVEYAHINQGKIFVKVDNGYELDELHNVAINTGSLSSGDLLIRSGSVWVNSKQLTGSYAITGSLNATSFSGSLQGTATTASYVQNAQSASYVLNAVSASYVLSSSFATTSSYALTAQTLLGSVVSASYAVTASLAQSVQFEGKPLSAGWPNNYIIPAKLTTPIISLAGSSTTDTSANIRYYPIQLSRDTLISSIGALVRGTLAANTGSYRLGIYNSTEASVLLAQGSTALPGTLLADYGLISQISTSQAFVQIAISDINRPTLKKGEIYWLAISPSGSTTQALGPSNATAWSDYFGIIPSTTTVASYIGLSVTADGGAALPNPANTSSIALLSTTNMKGFPILKITGSVV